MSGADKVPVEGTFLSVGGRFKKCSELGNFEAMEPKIQGVAMMMFFAGFSAALEALNELGELPEPVAVGLLDAMSNECEVFAGKAEAILAPQATH